MNQVFQTSQCKKLLLFVVGLLCSSAAFAQQQVSGTVTNDKGEVFPGASVVVKGSATGTVTNGSGKYTISIPDANAVLVFSAIGFTPLERPANGASTINIQLQPSIFSLDETVVIGYGTQKRVNLTGSLSSVKSEDLRANAVGNVSKALQGMAPGVDVTSPNTAGSNAKVRIHGLGTINNNDPLWVIDGVPVAGGIESLDPSEIESLTVLKDAASTAIYGSRGANGVILVTTVQGRKNQAPSMNLSVRMGTIRNNKKYDLLNPTEFGEMLWLQYKNSGITPTHPIYGSGAEPVIPRYLIPAGANEANLDEYNINNFQITEANAKGTDWYKEIYNPGMTQDYNLSINGGSEKVTYAVSGGYMQEDGMVKMTGFNRYNMRSNVHVNVTSWLEVGENLSLGKTRISGLQGEGLASPLGQVLELPSIMPVYDVMGNFAPVSRMTGLSGDNNPVGELTRAKDFISDNLRLRGNAYVQVTPLEGLTLRSVLGLDLNQSHFKQPLEKNPESYVARKYDQLTEGYGSGRQWSWTTTANYSRTFGDIHHIEIMAGTEAIDELSQSMSATRVNYFSTEKNYWVLSAGSGEMTNSGSASSWSLLSYFGRVHYDLNHRYLLDATLRRDGSSRFGKGKQYGTFPAVSAGWILSEEPFMEATRSWLDNFKLRASWGQSGNDQIGNYNMYDTYTSSLDFSYYPVTGSNNSETPGFQSNSFGNPDAHWETITAMNIGADVSFLDHFNLTVDVWQRNTTGMLYPKTVPSVYGIASIPSVNIGDMKNRGIDVQFNVHGYGIGKELTYNVTANFSHYKNTIVRLSDKDQEAIIGSAVREQTYIRSEKGTSFPEFYGYQILGIFQTDEEAKNYPTAFGADGTYNKAGHFKIKDVNGDGIIDDKDRTYIGDPHPDFTAGLTGNVTYKGFDLTASLYASYGNDLLNLDRRTLDFNLFLRNRSARRLYESWGSPYLKDNRKAKMPIAETNDAESQQPSSYYVEDGSYLRLSNLQLGYTLPSGWLKTIHLKHLRIYVMASNLFTITHYSGLDPSVSTSDRDFGQDFARWPTPQRFLVGIDLGL
jgi:TonB-linked SusC/RagA family outer membrane protein